MVFVLAEKTYEGYDYYDFFERVSERLKGAPFHSNLSSEKEVSSHPCACSSDGSSFDRPRLQCPRLIRAGYGSPFVV